MPEINSYYTHPKFRDVMFQLLATSQLDEDRWLWSVLFFHRTKGYFFGRDLLKVTADKIAEFIPFEVP